MESARFFADFVAKSALFPLKSQKKERLPSGTEEGIEKS
jgi:hypothetical protein